MKTKTILIVLAAWVALTVLVFQSCNKDKTNQPPSCKISSPTNGQVIPKGETVSISVDADAQIGNIVEVRFLIDRIDRGSVTSFPYNYNWNTNKENFGNHTLKAISFDNSGGSNYDEITIEISNAGTEPTALFTVTPSSGTTYTKFAFDASGSTDNEDHTSYLQVRWDFDGNGYWDTNWDTDKTQKHQYNKEGTYTAKLEVKDNDGLTDQYTNSITVSIGSITGTYTDPRDGQTYNTIIIDNEKWFAENLNYTTSTSNSWTYNNNPANGDIYGRLYNWEAASIACPNGWRLPSRDEWIALSDFLGGLSVAGGKMKETGTAHWNTPNTDATNSSGFTALPGGSRSINGSFSNLGNTTGWWSSTTEFGTYKMNPGVQYNHSYMLIFGSDRGNGNSVRCFKD
ncbi:MAG: FISUMP domain-containing protein [Bacteroidota bacterium]